MLNNNFVLEEDFVQGMVSRLSDKELSKEYFLLHRCLDVLHSESYCSCMYDYFIFFDEFVTSAICKRFLALNDVVV